MANYFQLSNGVRVASNQPIDGDRYIAVNLAARDNLVTINRAFEGLQVYIESGDTANTGLWLLTKLGSNSATTVWERIDIGGVSGSTNLSGLTDVTISNINSGDTLVYNNGIWINSAVTETTLSAGTGISLTPSPGFIRIDNSKYVSGFTINTLNNQLTIQLADSTSFTTDLGYLVDTDSYVCGGTYDSRSGGTIDFVTNSGYTFAVTGISNASMESLSDTNIISPTDNQILVYTGGTWVNSAATAAGENDWIDSNLTATKSAGGVNVNDFFASGTTFEQLFRAILAPTIQPELGSNPSATITGVNTSYIEVGETYNMTLNYTFNQGTINSRENYPTDHYIPRVGSVSSVTYSGSGTVNSSTGAVTGTATVGTMSWSVRVDYNSGTTPYYDSDNVESHSLDSYRVASYVVDSENRTGLYKYFVGESATTLSTSSSDVRALNDFFRTSSNFSFTYVIPSGNTYFGFFIEGAQKTIIHAYHQESSNSDEKDNFTITGPYTISDAGTGTASYYKYEQNIGGQGYTADATYVITIG